jgi:hypothetical protein
MKHKQSEVKQEQIEWRRDKVLDLSSKGHTEREIAKVLQVCCATIHRDLTILKQEAKKNISRYIDEQLPAEFHKCLVGITAIMKESWKTADAAESQGDRRDKLQALSLAKECYAMKLDLFSSATVVDKAVRFVDRHKDSGRGFMPQSTEVLIDDLQNLSIILDKYESQLGLG